MSRPADSSAAGAACEPKRRCRKWSCGHCGPIRAGDDFRKLLENLLAYRGEVVLIAVTAPGQDVLPWDESACSGRGPHRHYGPRRLSRAALRGWRWNCTASARYGRLMKAAQLHADRFIRRAWATGDGLPRRVAVAWSEQTRGVWHVHEALPAGSEIERVWTRQVVRFIEVVTQRDARRRRREANLARHEHYLGVQTRGFYGWASWIETRCVTWRERRGAIPRSGGVPRSQRGSVPRENAHRREVGAARRGYARTSLGGSPRNRARSKPARALSVRAHPIVTASRVTPQLEVVARYRLGDPARSAP